MNAGHPHFPAFCWNSSSAAGKTNTIVRVFAADLLEGRGSMQYDRRSLIASLASLPFCQIPFGAARAQLRRNSRAKVLEIDGCSHAPRS
jgi:hypothetical protein